MKPLKGVKVSIDAITTGLIAWCEDCDGSCRVRRLLLDYEVDILFSV
jgi:hypothetical protein